VVRSAATEEALVAAARLAAERNASVGIVSVLEVPLSLPLDAELPDEAAAHRTLDDAEALVEQYGVRAVGRLLRARSAGAEIVAEAPRQNA
jgi:nucleotide-binding universal stress UspA family protein